MAEPMQPPGKLRVAHVSATFPPYYAGTGNVALQNARSLAERGHRITVYTVALPGRPGPDVEGLEVHRLRPVLRIGLAALTPGLLRLERQDLVHLHYPFIFGAELVLLLERLKGQPFVLTYHNDLMAPGPKGVLFRGYQRLWARSVLDRARRIIVPDRDGASGSPVLARLLQRRPERFVEIPNGVDPTVFRPLPPDPGDRRRLDLPADCPVVLFVGSMDGAHHPKGGVPVLLAAAARLRGEAIVLLVGGGDQVPAYRALAESLGVASRVRFAGRVPHGELPPMYALADVVVQPSRLFEPFGLVAAEAMACGKPVIASDLPGVRRVVGEAGGGILVPPGDADELAGTIRHLLADKALRERLANAGRAGVIERYDARQLGPMLERAYAQALAAG